jgi:hypothetical protein
MWDEWLRLMDDAAETERYAAHPFSVEQDTFRGWSPEPLPGKSLSAQNAERGKTRFRRPA